MKGNNMVSDIQAIGRSQLPAAPAVPAAEQTPAVVAAAVPAAGQNKAPDIDRPKITTPKKVELSLNPEEKQQSLKAALNELNQQMVANKQNLGFRMDDAIHGPVITVHNTQTGEVLRQIPSETALKIAHSIDSLKGLFFSKKI
jgi:flagellar protein FlaG